ncbi:MAG: hypothetical protein DRR00_19910 [Candidatus Parabeggiatoa sp. nov. 3]|nr:MAG: hypothetical protein DRR00_19910 [Gammaproteobacteria bacterium]
MAIAGKSGWVIGKGWAIIFAHLLKPVTTRIVYKKGFKQKRTLNQSLHIQSLSLPVLLKD